MPRFRLNFIFLCAGVTIIIIVAILIFENNTTGLKISVLGGTYGNSYRSGPTRFLDSTEIILKRNVSFKVYTESDRYGNSKLVVVEKGKNSLFAPPSFDEIHLRCQAPFPVEWKYEGDGVVFGNLFNQRLTKNIDDPSSYMYVSSLVFDTRFRPITNDSTGKYYCTPRKTNESLNIVPENVLGFYDVDVIKGIAYDSFTSPGYHNFTQKTCNASAQNSNVNFYFNETEEAWFCCGNSNTPTIVNIYCDVPSACKLREKCPSEKFKCVEVYNETFSIGQSNQILCTKTKSLKYGSWTGQMECILDNQCGKFMTYVGSMNFVGHAFYPMDSTSVFVPPEKVLRIKGHKKEPNSITFTCGGPNFYLEYGFKWIVKTKDRTAEYVYGKDGYFGPPDEVSSELTINVDNKMDISSVTCVAPLLNSPTKWIEKSTTDIPV